MFSNLKVIKLRRLSNPLASSRLFKSMITISALKSRQTPRCRWFTVLFSIFKTRLLSWKTGHKAWDRLLYRKHWKKQKTSKSSMKSKTRSWQKITWDFCPRTKLLIWNPRWPVSHISRQVTAWQPYCSRLCNRTTQTSWLGLCARRSSHCLPILSKPWKQTMSANYFNKFCSLFNQSSPSSRSAL